ncbi:MAG: AcrR family transcriptional regulator [Gammaproteobacteria bacterium]|jgi:AcrR family transcriptional regulator
MSENLAQLSSTNSSNVAGNSPIYNAPKDSLMKYAEQSSNLPRPATPKGQATRNKLLNAAENEIGEKGFYTSSVNGITTRAGVGQGTFYLYFHSKEDVLRELVHHMGQELRSLLTESSKGCTNRLQGEREGMRAFFEFVKQRPNLYRVVMESQFVDPEIYRDYYDSFSRGYDKVLAAAAENGELSPGDENTRGWALMGIGHFLGLAYPLWQGETPTEEILDSVMDFIENGIGAK